MALLGELRVVEILALALEIGAGILQVGIKEELIDARVDVVMMRDVAPCPERVVGAPDPAQRGAALLQQAHPAGAAAAEARARIREIFRGEGDDVVERPRGDVDASVHVEFAEAQFRIDHEQGFGAAVVELNCRPFAGAVADTEAAPRGCPDLKRSGSDQPGEEGAKQVHSSHPGRERGFASRSAPAAAPAQLSPPRNASP